MAARAATAAAAAAALLLSAAAAAAAAAAPPHVVLIVADDLGYADVGCMGSSDVRTPHIDALHARGRRLENYYGQPVCSPSRAAIHTGRLPLALGLQTYVVDPTGVDYGLDLNETTLPQLLRDRAGYATHAVGKWHRKWQFTSPPAAGACTPPSVAMLTPSSLNRFSRPRPPFQWAWRAGRRRRRSEATTVSTGS